MAGGITFEPQDPSSFPLEQTTNIIRACSEQYIVSMLMANINVTALTALSSCTYTPDSVPRYGVPHASGLSSHRATGSTEYYRSRSWQGLVSQVALLSACASCKVLQALHHAKTITT